MPQPVLDLRECPEVGFIGVRYGRLEVVHHHRQAEGLGLVIVVQVPAGSDPRLKGFEKWDAVPRTGGWLGLYIGAPIRQKYVSAIGSRWPISARGRRLSTGCEGAGSCPACSSSARERDFVHSRSESNSGSPHPLCLTRTHECRCSRMGEAYGRARAHPVRGRASLGAGYSPIRDQDIPRFARAEEQRGGAGLSGHNVPFCPAALPPRRPIEPAAALKRLAVNASLDADALVAGR
jgi:hypothetical protein